MTDRQNKPQPQHEPPDEKGALLEKWWATPRQKQFYAMSGAFRHQVGPQQWAPLHSCKETGESIDMYSGLKRSSCSQFVNEMDGALSDLQAITDHVAWIHPAKTWPAFSRW